jgi:hypothetical protein
MDRDFNIAYDEFLDAMRLEEEVLAQYHLACEKCAHARARMNRLDRIRINHA